MSAVTSVIAAHLNDISNDLVFGPLSSSHGGTSLESVGSQVDVRGGSRCVRICGGCFR